MYLKICMEKFVSTYCFCHRKKWKIKKSKWTTNKKCKTFTNWRISRYTILKCENSGTFSTPHIINAINTIKVADIKLGKSSFRHTHPGYNQQIALCMSLEISICCCECVSFFGARGNRKSSNYNFSFPYKTFFCVVLCQVLPFIKN